MNYWDTSCLLKLYVSEPDSPVWLDSVRQQTSPILTSVLTETEFAFALMRKEAEGELRPRAAAALTQLLRNHAAQGQIRFIPLGTAVRDLAASLARRCMIEGRPSIPLRTLDGLHLATALSVRAARLLTADLRLRDAARHCGLETS